jgi:hypothetical protein
MQMVLGFHGRGRIMELRHGSTTSRPRPTPPGRVQYNSINKTQISQSSTPVHRTYKINPKPTLTPIHKINTQTDTKSTQNQPQHQYTKSTHKQTQNQPEVMIYLTPLTTTTPEERRKRSASLGRDRQTQAEIGKPSHRINHHHAEIGKPKPPNQPVLPSTTTFQLQTQAPRFVLQEKTEREERAQREERARTKRKESTELKREKKSSEMRGKEKIRGFILDGPMPRKSFFNWIQNIYKVYSSFSFVKSYCTFCKKIWR